MRPFPRPDTPSPAQAASDATWSRGKLMALLVCAAAAVLAVLAGLGWLLWAPGPPSTTSSGLTEVDTANGADGADGADGSPRGGAGEAGARRDELAAAPMIELGLDAAKPQPLSRQVARVLYLPAASGVDELGVATGFPATAAGAVAQLAAIDRAAISSAGPDGARAVIAAWAADGGPTPATWSGVAAMTTLYSAAGLPAGYTAGQVDYAPTMGLVKATDGPSFVVACVNGTVTVTFTQTARVAAADCQRMVWDQGQEQGRWVIGPGAEPADPPGAWPGSQVAIDVGWQELRDE